MRERPILQSNDGAGLETVSGSGLGYGDGGRGADGIGHGDSGYVGGSDGGGYGLGHDHGYIFATESSLAELLNA